MKRKAIEKIEPAKTRKKGHIATVQTLDDIAIINVFNDKVLAAAEYMGKAMEKAIRNMPGVSFGVLTKESFWKEFFETEVDRNGAEIECVN